MLTALLLALHAGASLALGAFGLHRYVIARRYRTVQPRRPRMTVPAAWPTVTVQLPVYNERYVVDAAVRALAALEYPRDRLTIQILDDSTDDTSERIARLLADIGGTGPELVHLRRATRTGFKAGALQAGLHETDAEFVAIFDADFIAPSDFLLRMMPEFQDPGIGMVQARWGHLNADASLLTRTQALQLDAHFTLEHGVRDAGGLFFNFNGTAGVWRRRAIEEAGGWNADTLTEDLDLSYRAQLAGWRFAYRDDVEVPAELPVEVSAYRNQQQRWAQGGIQTARKLLPSILRSRWPAPVKRSAAWHLLIHCSYPLLIAVAFLGLAVGFATTVPALRWVIAVDGIVLTVATAGLAYFYGVTARVRDPRRWRRRLWLVPAIMILGAGIACSQSLAVFRGLAGARTPFVRTPKYHRAGAWGQSTYRVPIGQRALLDALLGAVLMAAAGMTAALAASVPSSLVLLLGTGLLSVAAGTLLQRLGQLRRQSR